MTRRLRIVLIIVALATVMAGVRLWPRPSILSAKETSTAIFDREGRLLRLTMTSAEVFRVYVPLSDMSPSIIEATLLKEDKYFYYHPGVNPISFGSAVYSTLMHGAAQRGASTITMQLARILYHLNTRSIFGKLRQIYFAESLEARYSKDEILEAYLNLAPYGGNIEGVATASLVYFKKRASQLTLSESITLAIIPQSPSARGLFKNSGLAYSARFQTERKRLYDAWRVRHPTAALETLEWPTIHGRREAPFLAPHFTDLILQRTQRTPIIETTLDLKSQQTIESAVKSYIVQKQEMGIRNAAVALLHYPTMELRAMVGSADYFSSSISGQVNGYTALRSPGSTLKPFAYALGIDQGVIHDLSVLKDVPVSYGGFDPENYDNQFTGPISVHDALIRSRNIPAVGVSAQLKSPDLFDFLHASSIRLPFSKEYYGLGLVLGGAEVTIENLLSLYGILANRGVAQSIRYTASAESPPSRRLLSRESSHMILDILRDNPRLSTTLTNGSSRDHFPVSWKTGTSHGFRDAWTVGVFGPYVLVVWLGNFDNSENPALIGRDMAAPLFFRVAEALYQNSPSISVTHPSKESLNIQQVEVCPLSGRLRGKHCPSSALAQFIPGVSPIHSCDIHRLIAINPVSGLRACNDQAGNQWRVFEFWPSDVMKAFAAIGLPRQPPPKFDPLCALSSRSTAGEPVRIISPRSRVVYRVRVSEKSQPIAFRASTDSSSRKVFWYLDKAYLGSTDSKLPMFWNPIPGKYIVKAVDEVGHSAERHITVESSL